MGEQSSMLNPKFQLIDVTGAIITFKSFQSDFNYGTHSATRTNSLVVGIQQAGAFVGCWAIWPIAAHWGRRRAIMVCSAVFTLGAVIQTINTHSLGAFYVGRVISGLGLGGSSVIISMFSSENAPKEIRGRLGTFPPSPYSCRANSFRRVLLSVNVHVCAFFPSSASPL
jgi:MFS family permease